MIFYLIEHVALRFRENCEMLDRILSLPDQAFHNYVGPRITFSSVSTFDQCFVSFILRNVSSGCLFFLFLFVDRIKERKNMPQQKSLSHTIICGKKLTLRPTYNKHDNTALSRS